MTGESYDPQKMCHSHSIYNQKPVKKVEPHPDEENIESDQDSYGDEQMAFCEIDPVVLGDGLTASNEGKSSPISDQFE